MKNILYLLLLLILASCSKDDILTSTDVSSLEFSGENAIAFQEDKAIVASYNQSTSTPCGTPFIVDFYAGINILVGDVTITNDATNLYIELDLDGALTSLTHLYVGDPANIPTNPSGNPIIGLFPYQTTHSPMVSNYVWTIPLSGLDSCFAIALHADVHLIDDNGTITSSETAWADGEDFTNAGSWASYFTYCIQSCCEIVADTFQIYGGQTIPVGELIITNDATNLYVTWTLSGCWELEETHLYVGDAQNLPTNNANVPIPGQFPYQTTHSSGTTTYTYTVPLAGLPPCYIIAAHAAVVNPCTGEEETAWSDGIDFPNTNRWGWYSPYCTQVCD